MLLTDVFETLYLPLRLRGKSKETSRLHRHSLRQFGKYLGHDPTTDDLTDAKLAGLMYWGRERGLAAPSVNKWRNHICALWRFAARKKIVADWPDVESDVEPEVIPRAWLGDELERLFDACRRQAGWIAGVRADLWWVALHLLLYDTSERIGAMLRLAWENVDLDGGWVTFPAETRKGGRKARMYRIASETVEALRLILVPIRKLVFPWDRNPTHIWTRYGKVLESAGLPHDRRSKFHRIRRTTASLYEAHGGNATELLGHSNRRVTLGYLDPRLVQTPQAIDRLPRPGGRTPAVPADRGVQHGDGQEP